MRDGRPLSEDAAADHQPPRPASPGKSDFATSLQKVEAHLARVEARLDDLDTYLRLDLGSAVPDAVRNAVEERIARYREAVEERAEAAAIAATQEAVNAVQAKVAQVDQEIRTMRSQLAALRAEVQELRQRDHQLMSECFQVRAEHEALRARIETVRLCVVHASSSTNDVYL